MLLTNLTSAEYAYAGASITSPVS